MSSFNRENISYEVRYKALLESGGGGGGGGGGGDGALSDLVSFVKSQHKNSPKNQCSGIIYCFKRKDCEKLAKQISRLTSLQCLPYHAGLKDAIRQSTQDSWMTGRTPIVAATIAFGMGIDRASVRYVVHWR